MKQYTSYRMTNRIFVCHLVFITWAGSMLSLAAIGVASGTLFDCTKNIS